MKTEKKHPPISHVSKWQALLANLNDDPEIAANQYIHFHEALTEFFIHQGASTPTELADETMERVAELIAAGKTITSYKFFYSVARYIWKENFRKSRNLEKAVDKLLLTKDPGFDPEQLLLQKDADRRDRARLKILKQSLDRLTAEEKEMIILYYEGDQEERIANRKALARQFRVTPAVLRVKVSRLREKIEKDLSLQEKGNLAKKR